MTTRDDHHAPTIAGRSVSRLALGCWRMTTASTDEATRLVDTALDLGVTLVDTADVYGLDWGGTGFGSCEERLGAVLAARPDLRERMVLATKGGIIPGVPYDSSPTHLTAACEASLRRLGVDHVDLYMVHRPDMFAHPAQTAEALLSLRERGLIRAIGVSNHSTAQVDALQRHLGEPVAAVQPEFSVAATGALRDGTLDVAMRDASLVMAWSPLAGGRIVTGEGLRPTLLQTLDALAEEHATDRSTIALAFVLAHPSCPSAILGTQDPARLAAATRALHVTLSRTEIYSLVEASEGVRLP